jgi:hypothetical protein
VSRAIFPFEGHGLLLWVPSSSDARDFAHVALMISPPMCLLSLFSYQSVLFVRFPRFAGHLPFFTFPSYKYVFVKKVLPRALLPPSSVLKTCDPRLFCPPQSNTHFSYHFVCFQKALGRSVQKPPAKNHPPRSRSGPSNGDHDAHGEPFSSSPSRLRVGRKRVRPKSFDLCRPLHESMTP